MNDDIDQVLIGRDDLDRRVTEVARQIAGDIGVAASGVGAAEITIVPILTGSIIFVSDLIRKLPLPMQIHLVSVSAYPGRSTRSRGARIRSQLTSLPEDLADAHVLVVDDILDTGGTLGIVRDLVLRSRPRSLRTCVLLRKRRPAAMAFPVDYVCFDIPDVFVVGCGLDYNGYYRNLPDIVTLRQEVTAGADA